MTTTVDQAKPQISSEKVSKEIEARKLRAMVNLTTFGNIVPALGIYYVTLLWMMEPQGNQLRGAALLMQCIRITNQQSQFCTSLQMIYHTHVLRALLHAHNQVLQCFLMFITSD